MSTTESTAVLAVRRWVDLMVVGLNLCPFARTEVVNKRVHFVETEAQSEVQLLEDLATELTLLAETPSIETTLLVHPQVLKDFSAYNQFLDEVDALLHGMHLDGEMQVASFHPDYQFAGTAPDDAENYTNRAPYPVLHIIREASIEDRLDSYPDAAAIPERNIKLMNKMGRQQLQGLLARCSS